MRPQQALELAVHSAGVCTAAGGLAASLAALSGNAPGPLVELLEAYDCCAAPVQGLAAHNLQGRPMQPWMHRVQAMLELAVQDLCDHAMLSRAELMHERLFVVDTESATAQGALCVSQAWLNLQAPLNAAALSGQRQRISQHSTVVEALAAAGSYLASAPAGQSHALVLACETWLCAEALERLDDIDQLRSASSDGVLPSEAAVLLRLGGRTRRIRCAAVQDPQPRWNNEQALGTPISEALLHLQGQAPLDAKCVLVDLHSSQLALRRESEFLRCRHWPHLAPDGPAWLNTATLGYVGHCMSLLQLAMLAQLPATQLPAQAYARSLWQDGLVAQRLSDPNAGVDHGL